MDWIEDTRAKTGLTEDDLSIIQCTIYVLEEFLKTNTVDKGHGLSHCTTVLQHVIDALPYHHLLATEQMLAIMLAALLHDVDDSKFFKTANYANARKLLREIPCSHRLGDDFIDLVIEMIDLVSCSKNRNTPLPSQRRWKLLPRDADRLEAIGEMGIARCYEYSGHRIPLFLPTDERVTTEEELAQVATEERFNTYTGGSGSMVSHFYDKLVHICHMSSGNPWMDLRAKELRVPIVEFIFEYGRTGTVDEQKLKDLASKHLY